MYVHVYLGALVCMQHNAFHLSSIERTHITTNCAVPIDKGTILSPLTAPLSYTQYYIYLYHCALSSRVKGTWVRGYIAIYLEYITGLRVPPLIWNSEGVERCPDSIHRLLVSAHKLRIHNPLWRGESITNSSTDATGPARWTSSITLLLTRRPVVTCVGSIMQDGVALRMATRHTTIFQAAWR